MVFVDAIVRTQVREGAGHSKEIVNRTVSLADKHISASQCEVSRTTLYKANWNAIDDKLI